MNERVRAGILGIGLAGILAVVGPTPCVRAESAAAVAQEAEFPCTPAGSCAQRFVECWNASSRESWEAFETTFASSTRLSLSDPAARASRIMGMCSRSGTLEVSRVQVGLDGAVTLEGELESGGPVEMTFNMSATEPGKLDAVMIARAPGSGQPTALTPGLRSQTVRAVASAVEERYVFPDVGRRMGEALRTALKNGAYDSIERSGELARRLTDDLRVISHDRHLGVRPASPASGGDTLAIPGAGERGNFGFRTAELLDGNIGYIRLDGFVPGPNAERTAAAAMAFVAHCDALIFDLRFNGGGSPEMIRFLTSYLVDEPTHLNDMVDREGEVVEEYWTLGDVPGQRLGASIPTYVLTSSFTFSGAEEFAYNLKNLKRATIVGETTGGGAHPVRGERVNDYFMVGVPFMRARNPITGTNWEGAGVEPDVAVSSDQALERALDLARGAGG